MHYKYNYQWWQDITREPSRGKPKTAILREVTLELSECMSLIINVDGLMEANVNNEVKPRRGRIWDVHGCLQGVIQRGTVPEVKDGGQKDVEYGCES